MKKSMMGKFDFMTFAGNVGGAIVAKVVVSKLPIKNNTIKSIAPIALGILLSSNKNKMISGAGFGMIAVGGAQLVSTVVPGLNGIMGDSDFLSLGAPAGDVLEGFDDEMMNGADDFFISEASGQVLEGTSDEFIAEAEDFMA